jgi:hypothetical protein
MSVHIGPDARIERERFVQQQDAGRLISACAMASRCCIPPDICAGSRCRLSPRPTAASIAAASAARRGGARRTAAR